MEVMIAFSSGTRMHHVNGMMAKALTDMLSAIRGASIWRLRRHQQRRVGQTSPGLGLVFVPQRAGCHVFRHI